MQRIAFGVPCGQSRVCSGVTTTGSKSGLSFSPEETKDSVCLTVGRSLRPLAFLSPPFQLTPLLEAASVSAGR